MHTGTPGTSHYIISTLIWITCPPSPTRIIAPKHGTDGGMAAPDVLNRPWMCSVSAEQASECRSEHMGSCRGSVPAHASLGPNTCQCSTPFNEARRSTLRITSIGSTYPPEGLHRGRIAYPLHPIRKPREEHCGRRLQLSCWRRRGPTCSDSPSADFEASPHRRRANSVQHPAHSTQHRASLPTQALASADIPLARSWWWGGARSSSVPGLCGHHRCREPCLARSHSSAFAARRSIDSATALGLGVS
jgi:hypothetical protein